MTDLERFAALFAGLDRAHGVARPTDQRSGRGKVEARYVTRAEPVTAVAWQRHLAGEEGLVIHPLRVDGTVSFGAIDVDVYPLDLPDLAHRVAEAGLPLVVCSTKSGGAHLYLFLAEPTSAELVQRTLMDWAVSLGYPRVEVFPKQTSLASERDFGNGINVPYFGDSRHAVAPDGSALNLPAFLARAEELRLTATELGEVRVKGDDLLIDAPPCLQRWAQLGVGEGQRNEVMFDFAVFARRCWPDDWKARFEELNRRYGSPPLPANEVLTIIKSVGKAKDYLYKAKCEGPYCSPQLCRQRKHGRGGGYDDAGVTIDGLVVVTTEPRIFIVTVGGKSVEMDSATFLDQRKFRLRVVETLLLKPRPLKAAAWEALTDRLLNQAEVRDAPEDAGVRGQLRHHLEEFFARHPGKDRGELLHERCWTDPDAARTYFRSPDFIAYLRRHRVTGWTPKDVYQLVRTLGGDSELVSAAGEKLRCWWVPAAEVVEAALPVPKFDADEPEVPF